MHERGHASPQIVNSNTNDTFSDLILLVIRQKWLGIMSINYCQKFL